MPSSPRQKQNKLPHKANEVQLYIEIFPRIELQLKPTFGKSIWKSSWSQDVVHGDLCAGNILLCSANNKRGFIAKVADFGLGRDKLAEPVNTHT